MTITYDEAVMDDITLIRMEIGDGTEGDGPRPNSDNFSDQAITRLLGEEGNVGRTAARLSEILSREWAIVPTQITAGGLSERSNAAYYWGQQGMRLRAQYGEAGKQAGFNFVAQPLRQS